MDVGPRTSNFGLLTLDTKTDRRLVKLSKFLTLILRHQPERFALELDDEGWASLSEVMEILRGLPNFRWATRADVMVVVEEGSGDGKRRFQVEGNRIRRSVDS